MDAQFQRFRQVAIFVSALDRDAADTVLAQLSDEEAAAVRRAILSLDDVSDEEQAAALAEFKRRGERPQQSPVKRGALDSGVELDAGLSARLQEPTGQDLLPSAHAKQVHAEVHGARPAFDCLRGIDGAWLASLLAQEHPQTIAVVVSHLPQPQAVRFLQAVSSRQQTDILRRLADLDEMDADSLRLIERHLEERLSEQLRSVERRTAGVSNVAAILRAADPLTRNRLVKQLRQSDQQLAEQLKDKANQTSASETKTASVTNVSQEGNAQATPSIAAPPPPTASLTNQTMPANRPSVHSFDDLAKWTDRALKVLLKECEPELILLALTGASDRVVRRILEMFPPAQEATLRHALLHPGPTRISDVESAQQEILQLAVQMEAAGRLSPHAKRLSMAA